MTGNRTMLRRAATTMALGLCCSTLTVLSPLLTEAGAVATPGDTVFINELHYDNTGADAGEFVEIAGPAGTDLTGWRVIPYNGAGGANYSPQGNFSGTIPDQGDGFGTASVAILGLQNGSPDGIALVDGANVVRQFLSYEGVFTATASTASGLTSTDIGVSEAGTEAIGLSLGLTGTGTTYGEFAWTTGLDDSAGLVNPGQTFGEVPDDVAPVIDAATPADQSVASGATATLTVATTAGTAPLSYQWYQGTTGDTSTAVGTDSPSYTTPALTSTTSYWVRVTNAFGSDDSRTATVTVLAPATIHGIQGAGHLSPLAGQPVVGVTGIVTALRSNGFYVQEPDAEVDANVATSEAILVFTSSAPPAAAVVGNHVSVSGTVTEFRPSATNLTITEITSPSVSVLSTGNPLPALTTVGGAAEGNLRQPPLALIDEDAVAPGEEGGTVEDAESVFDPTNDGIDFYETLEGMRVGVTSPQAVSRTTDFGATSHEIGIVPGDFAAAGTRTPRGGILYEGYDQDNPEMLVLADSPRLNGVGNLPSVDVGDGWQGEVVGILDYAFDNPLLLLSDPLPAFVDGNLQSEVTGLVHGDGQLTIATFNLENIDGLDAQEKFDGLAQQIVTNLLSPDIVVVEEIQDNDGALTPSPTTADVTWQRVIDSIVAAGGPVYDFRQIDPSVGTDGGEPGGNIRVGFLFRTDTGVDFVDRAGGDATTANSVVDVGGVPQLALSPGRIDPTNTAFNASRKPLVGEFTFAGRTIFVVGNHWNSKGGDQPRYGRFQPPNRSSEVQRLQQAAIVENFVDDITAIDPNANVVIAGDLNDYLFSPAVQILTTNGYTSLVTTLPANERYGYVFDGNSQILDHILASPALAGIASFDTVHVNSEFYAQQSDHDPSVARFSFDVTAPTVTAEVTGALCSASIYSTSALVTLTSDDPDAAITYATRSPGAAAFGPDTAYTAPFSITDIGTTQVRFSATDPDGNTSPTETISVTVTDFGGGVPSDTFNRPNGSLGSAWGNPNTNRFRIQANTVLASGGGTAVYRPELLGTTQEAFVRFVDAPTAKGEKGLLLKVQAATNGVPDPSLGAISVVYDVPPHGAPTVDVLARTASGGNALQGRLTSVTLAAGSQLGARVLPSGEVRIYVDCVHRGSVQLTPTVTSFFAARGGTAGLMSAGSGTARLDDFGVN